jgi:hypothetical protein
MRRESLQQYHFGRMMQRIQRENAGKFRLNGERFHSFGTKGWGFESLRARSEHFKARRGFPPAANVRQGACSRISERL